MIRDGMQAEKIAVIVYHLVETDISELLETLTGQELPANVGVELINVEATEEQSRAEAYNIALTKTEAKYKIYIEADVRILDKELFVKVLKAFQEDETLGVIGVSGTCVLPADGICISAEKRAGHIVMGEGEDQQEIDWNSRAKDNELIYVEAVDGWFFATQYDLKWREDLFQKDFFLAASQSLEFIRRGYRCGVLSSKQATVQQKTVKFSYEHKLQNVFLDEYSKEFFPLVSVVIPTYQRPKWFKEALDSVLAQTYRNIEIFITDNSHNTETRDLMQTYLAKHDNIIYEHHPEYKDAGENWRRARAYNNPSAEYVNWLMDDDLFKPDKIQKMIDVYRQQDNVALVTSFRECINGEGKVVSSLPGFQKVFAQDTRVAGKVAGWNILAKVYNFVGEPTTVLIKKAYMNKGYDLGWSGRDDFFFISDYPTWLNCLEHGDLIYLSEPLSQTRIHAGQDQWSMDTGLCLAGCYGSCVQYAYKKGKYITSPADYLRCLRNFRAMYNGRVMAAKEKGCDLGTFWGAAKLQQLVEEIDAATREFSR